MFKISSTRAAKKVKTEHKIFTFTQLFLSENNIIKIKGHFKESTAGKTCFLQTHTVVGVANPLRQ